MRRAFVLAIALVTGCAGAPQGPPATTQGTLPASSTASEVRDSEVREEAPDILSIASELIGRGDIPSLRKAGELLIESDLDQPEARAMALNALELYLRQATPEELSLIIPLIEEAHEKGVATPDTYLALARARATADSPQGAFAALDSALDLDPFHSGSLLLRALLLLAEGKADDAAETLDTLLEHHPLHDEALLVRARLYHDRQGDSTAALELAERGESAFAHDPRFPELRGEILLELGRIDEAQEALDLALRIDPHRRRASVLMARALLAEGRWSEAEEALSVLPGFETETELLMAHAVYAHLDRTDRLLAAGRRLYELDSSYAGLYAADLMGADRLELAAGVIEEALAAVEPGAVKSRLFLYRSRLRTDPFGDEAMRDLRSSLAEDPENSDTLVALAKHLERGGDTAKAHHYASLALERLPNDDELRSFVEKLAGRLEDTTE